MFGQNQAECCSGDTGDCLPTSVVAAGPGVSQPFAVRGEHELVTSKNSTDSRVSTDR
jgi:hypothetical protein